MDKAGRVGPHLGPLLRSRWRSLSRCPSLSAAGPAAGVCFLLLALALSSLFVQRYDTGHFAHPRAFHNHQSAVNLVLAANLSVERGLMLFRGEQPQPDGTTIPDMYSRFPVGGYALIKLAMLPFEGDPSAQIIAARVLMLALFCAAAALAFDSLRRIAAEPYVALAATLLAFSSLNLLRWSDMVSTEAMNELFAFFLAFHGMVLRWQGRGSGQLVAKICAALLLGWFVYGLLLAYVAIGLGVEIAGAWRRFGPRMRLRAAALVFVRSRYLALALTAIAFGSAVLGFNLANEHAAYGGERALAELPTVESAKRRLGFDPSYSVSAASPRFLYGQFRRIGTAMLPALAEGGVSRARGASLGALATAALGALALAACAGGLLFARLAPGAPGTRALLATLAFSGIAWCFPMRHGTASHQFYELYYVGVPLTLFVLLLMAMCRLGPKKGGAAAAAAAVAAVPLFTISVAVARHTGWPDDEQHRRAAQAQRTTLKELAGIRDVVVGKTAFFAYGADLSSPSFLHYSAAIDPARLRGGFVSLLKQPRGVPYFALAGVRACDDWGGGGGESNKYPRCAKTHQIRDVDVHDARPESAPGTFPERRMAYDFIVVALRTDLGKQAELAELARNDADPALLTPDNRFALLYDGAAFATVHDFYRHWFRWQYRALAVRRPTVRSAFDLHLLAPQGRSDYELAYVKAECSEPDVLGRFFVHVVPRDERSLPGSRRQDGLDSLDFRFDAHGTFVDGGCLARVRLPDYDWLRISTGRHTEDSGEIWRQTIEIGDLAPSGIWRAPAGPGARIGAPGSKERQ